MKKIILDTNFLLIPYQFKVDIFSEIRRIADFNYKLYIVDETLDELIKLTKTQKGKDKLAAVLALAMLEQKKVIQIKTKKDKDVDNLILDEADKNTLVATQDRILKAKLKKKGAGLIVLKNKSHLVLI